MCAVSVCSVTLSTRWIFNVLFFLKKMLKALVIFVGPPMTLLRDTKNIP